MKNIGTVLIIFVLQISSISFSQNFWEQTNGPTGGSVMTISANSNNILFAGSRGGGVLRSTDDGDSWEQINNGLTTNSIASIAINSSDHIFAASNSGIFRSIDDGENWIEVNNGLSYPFVISLAINSNDEIFAGTFEGGGVLDRPITVRTGHWW